MSTKKVYKTLHYLRSWHDDNCVLDLESTMNKMLLLAPKAQDTEIVENEIIKRIQHRDGPKESKGLFLYLSYAPQDEHMRTMNIGAEGKNDDGGTTAPPDGQSFVTKEAFLHIRKHHFLFCGNGMRIENVESYLNLLNIKLKKKYDELPYMKLSLRPVLNVNKFRLIEEHGVKYIGVNATAHQLSIDELNNSQKERSIIKKGLDQLGKIISKEKTNEECQEIADLQINLSFELKGNTRASAIAHQKITQEAKNVIENSSKHDLYDFQIITQKGEKITASDVKLSKQGVGISKYGPSNGLYLHDVYNKLQEYYFELEQSNLTEL